MLPLKSASAGVTLAKISAVYACKLGVCVAQLWASVTQSALTTAGAGDNTESIPRYYEVH